MLNERSKRYTIPTISHSRAIVFAVDQHNIPIRLYLAHEKDMRNKEQEKRFLVPKEKDFCKITNKKSINYQIDEEK